MLRPFNFLFFFPSHKMVCSLDLDAGTSVGVPATANRGSFTMDGLEVSSLLPFCICVFDADFLSNKLKDDTWSFGFTFLEP